jgi:hypothetical protein
MVGTWGRKNFGVHRVEYLTMDYRLYFLIVQLLLTIPAIVLPHQLLRDFAVFCRRELLAEEAPILYNVIFNCSLSLMGMQGFFDANFSRS